MTSYNWDIVSCDEVCKVDEPLNTYIEKYELW